MLCIQGKLVALHIGKSTTIVVKLESTLQLSCLVDVQQILKQQTKQSSQLECGHYDIRIQS